MEGKVRKLYRSRKNRWIAGVCGGLSEYFKIDPVIVRVIFIVITLGGAGFGVILYIVLIFMIPIESLDFKIQS